MEVFLILFEGFDLLFNCLEVSLGLSHGDLGAEKEQTHCQ